MNHDGFIPLPGATQSFWLGKVAIGFGIGVFEGQSGENREHQHLAHQITTSIKTGDKIEIRSRGMIHRAEAFFIPSGTPHQLVPNQYRSIYIDTTHILAKTLSQHLEETTELIELPTDLEKSLQNSCQQSDAIQFCLEHFMTNIGVPTKFTTPRTQIEHVLEHLHQGILTSNIPDRQYLANLLNISESRFSHWFCEQTGMPLRSYRKWLRLISGLQQMRENRQLTDIAHQAQFSDQAHFTRTCVQMFGVRPSHLMQLQNLEFMTL